MNKLIGGIVLEDKEDIFYRSSVITDQKSNIKILKYDFENIGDLDNKIATIENIDIYLEKNCYFFKYLNNILVKVDMKDTWYVFFSNSVSKSAVEEIILKMILPIYCFVSGFALPMHATSIFKGTLSICFAGKSTVGKSTLAASFIIDEGFELFSDDILNFRCEDNMIYSYNYLSVLKLREESCLYFGDKLNGSLISSNKNRFLVKDLVILETSEDVNINCSISKVGKNEKIRYVLQNMYASNLCPYSDCVLRNIIEISQNINIWRLKYKKKYANIKNVKKIILQQLEN